MNQSSNAPYGYDLVENQTEQQVIRQIVAMRAEGLGPKAIANTLNEKGIPTKSRKNPWLFTTILRILGRHVR
jgi:hypothetical protein